MNPLRYDIIFQAAMTILAAGYMFMLVRYPRCLTFFAGSVVRAGRVQTLAGETRYDRLLNIAFAAGIITLALTLTRYAAAREPDVFSTPASSAASIGMAAGAVLLTVVFQIGLLKAAGKVARKESLVSTLLFLKKFYFAASAAFVIPAALFTAEAPLWATTAWLYILYTLAVATTALFLRDGFILFQSKKLSIFHWFLYLCTVEVFPVSLLATLAVRNI